MMMRDNVAEVSNAAVRFTESLGIQAIKPLATLLGATDVRVRENVVRLLSRLQDTAVIELLLRALSDSDAQVRQLATDALLGIGQPVFDALAEAAKSPDGKIRWKAVDAMTRLQDTRATHTLVNVLEDYEADIREMAANALQELGWRPQTPQQHMAYAIAHKNWEALTSFGAQAILPLLNFVNAKDIRIRRYIHQKLSQACLQVKSVAFEEGWQQPFEEQSTLHNIDVAALSMPFSKLQRLYIHAETYDFHLTERFMTYAVNVLGEKLLKKQVHVYVLGNPEHLNPNLLNMFKNLCKSVRFESA
jgi:HEAT repeat protein